MGYFWVLGQPGSALLQVLLNQKLCVWWHSQHWNYISDCSWDVSGENADLIPQCLVQTLTPVQNCLWAHFSGPGGPGDSVCRGELSQRHGKESTEQSRPSMLPHKNKVSWQRSILGFYVRANEETA